MQLFLVPGLIVVAVIGVWALFGKLSNSEQDWRELVQEIRSTNEHRRWRAATGLAQVLRVDIEMGDSGQQLSSNPQIAKELSALLTELLADPASDEQLINQQVFIIRTLGWLDAQEPVLVVLTLAMDADQDRTVRSDAIRSVAIMAGRAAKRARPFSDETVTDRLLELSRDSEPLIRQTVAFALGLVPGAECDQRLRVMAEDADRNTRVNAAIGLARPQHQSADGLPVFIDVLKNARKPVDPDGMDGDTPEARLSLARSQENMNLLILGNVLLAVRDIRDLLSSGQKDEVLALVQPLADDHPEPRIRIEALNTIRELSETESGK